MKRILSLVLAVFMLCSCTVALADSYDNSRVVIGADLSEAEVSQVYGIFGIKRGDVEELTVTNADEREYLEGLVDESIIGSRAISCIYIKALDENKGLDVSVNNISWCTPEMYMNAMVTAGITDADVTVAAPFSVSGTAALTGIYKAYEDITGTKLDDVAKAVGTQELTTTADLAEDIGSDESAAIVNDLKLIIDETAKMSDDELRQKIIDIAAKYDVELTDAQISKLIELCRSMEKLDVNQLKEKVENVQQYLKGIIDNPSGIINFFRNIGNSFSGIIDAIIGFFQNLLEN